MMRFDKAFLIIITLLISNNSFAEDTIQFKIIVWNVNIEHKIYFYKYKIKNKNDLIYKIKTQEYKIDSFNYYLLPKAKNSPFEFWIFVKNKYFFGGRWVRISTIYENEKNLLIYFSNVRKRKYCYDSKWINKKLNLKFR